MKPERTASKGLCYSPFEGIRKRVLVTDRKEKIDSAATEVRIEEIETDEEVFFRAMADVVPIEGDADGEVDRLKGAAKKNACPVPESIEVMTELNELVSGRSILDARYSEEYVSWCAPDLVPARFWELRRGRIPVQAYADLHGLSMKEAKIEVDEFILKCIVERLRCVLLVHGRGRNSEHGEPILKKGLIRWLRSGANARRVQAFASALGYDGGFGAMYVLLSKTERGQRRR
ncbi:MAG: Smr/MutS family protein [Deltaproteobacteria bacterium]|nr:Smr/MutS family protein [Deltaproteobacteria bacterium]